MVRTCAREREGGGCIWRRREGGVGESLSLAGCFIGFNVRDKVEKVGFTVEKFEIGEGKRFVRKVGGYSGLIDSFVVSRFRGGGGGGGESICNKLYI